MSLSEADMNLHHHMNSTPNKTPRLDHEEENDEDILQNTLQTNTSKDQSIDDEQVRGPMTKIGF